MCQMFMCLFRPLEVRSMEELREVLRKAAIAMRARSNRDLYTPEHFSPHHPPRWRCDVAREPQGPKPRKN